MLNSLITKGNLFYEFYERIIRYFFLTTNIQKPTAIFYKKNFKLTDTFYQLNSHIFCHIERSEVSLSILVLRSKNATTETEEKIIKRKV
ncbi:MAG TPA: hypothetical protein VNG53_07935 [Bacteroidia bacterium]|nr:hypothetical protein [Bacteroidia bacterium]